MRKIEDSAEPTQSLYVTAVEELAPREVDVLRLITNGLSNREIGGELFLGINTVKTHIKSAYRRIGVETRTQAVVWGARHGLLDGYDVVPTQQDEEALRRVV